MERSRIKVRRKALLAAYTTRLGSCGFSELALKASNDAKVITAPLPRSIMPGRAFRINRTGARTLSLTSSSAVSGGSFKKGM